MKTIEFNPEGKPTALTQNQTQGNDIFLEILPVIFHKLKNKLTPILGYAQILRSRSLDDFTIERLQKIENNASELTHLLNVLKDFFRVEPAAKKSGNINHILQILFLQQQEIAASEKVTMRLDLAADIPNMPLHSVQMQLLLQHMTANSLKALQMKAAAKKEIQLATRLEAGELKLIVRDNGIGMNEEELNDIWTPFYSKYSDCAGLGLVICEKIIANHGATCLVSSRPGEFSQFEVIFPLPATPPKKPKKIRAIKQTDKK